MARFVSPDTIVPDPVNPQGLNRYSYVENGPLGRVDPSGHRSCSAQEAASGDETCEENYTQYAVDPNADMLAYQLARAEALEYYWDNFDLPFDGNPPITSEFGAGHADGVDWGGTFDVYAPAPGRVVRAGLNDTAGMWRIRNVQTQEVREWSKWQNGLHTWDRGDDGLYEPQRLLATGDWEDIEPGWSHSQGTTIRIDHGHDLQTVYYHVSIDNAIAEGVDVDAGDTLGQTANIGWSTGAHLHYGVWFGYGGRGEWLNPLRPINSQRFAQ